MQKKYAHLSNIIIADLDTKGSTSSVHAKRCQLFLKKNSAIYFQLGFTYAFASF